MVFAALNSLQYLETKERIKTCFVRVLNFLRPRGYFLFMVQRIDLASFADGSKVVVDWIDKPVVDEEKRISVRSKFVSYVEPDGSRIIKKGRNTEVVECVTFSPILTVCEYVEMLHHVGFSVQVFSGYDERPEDEFERPIGFKFIELVEYLEHLLGRRVDVLTPAGLQGIRVSRVAQDITESIVYV